jgi:N-acetylmuramoyl-L-alanine amidase
MNNRYPLAEWRPLSANNNEPHIGKPSVLIFHTMVGYLTGTDSMFFQNGYGGVESHFGVGGKYDGSLDGAVYQWQLLDYQADAQYDGNAYATSVETSDGGHPEDKWSPKQVQALIDLTVWWCHNTGNPCKLVHHPTDKGIGYHQQFTTWNRSGHNCPGPTRVHQLIFDVIPKAKAILDAGNKPEEDMPDAKEIAEAIVRQGYNAHGQTVGYYMQTNLATTTKMMEALAHLESQMEAMTITLQAIKDAMQNSST